MFNKFKVLLFLGLVSLSFQRCNKDDDIVDVEPTITTPAITATPYALTIPAGFPTVTNMPTDNPMTEEGVALGKKLFFDPILSKDSTQSCGSCHAQQFGFSDNNKQFSTGVDGFNGDRNAPTIINILWAKEMFWDGRAATLEEQALGPVENPIEMHLSWDTALLRLKNNPTYVTMFQGAFQTVDFTKEHAAMAIAQFERTFISNNSRYDKYLRGELILTAEELRGEAVFFSEDAECFHCHTTGDGSGLLTDNLFHNNGLDPFFTDKGLGKTTYDANDDGKFKTPTLRNIELSSPYMHDGRFNTLEDVIEFYSSGVVVSATVDPLVQSRSGGVQLDLLSNVTAKADLVAFLKTFTDTAFINNPAFAPPVN
jgi:cytochrome c peroxidase